MEFEGEYKNGKKFKGKSYEYNDVGFSEFEGEYSNNEKWIGTIREFVWENKEKIIEKNIIEGIIV